MTEDYSYNFSQIVVSRGKYLTGCGTEYVAVAHQLVAIPGRDNTYHVLKFSESKESQYSPKAGDRIAMSLLRIKLTDLYAQFVRGVSKEEVEKRFDGFASQEPLATPA